jgi:hypothetical protein
MVGQAEKVNLSKLRVEQPQLIETEVKRILSRPKREQTKIVGQILKNFKLKNENTRWVIGIMIEYFLDYDPALVPRQIILDMAEDKSFSVRSSAAVCFFKLANIAPAEVPLDILQKLASAKEDWYVSKPAQATLKVLSHKRQAAVGILVDMISKEDIEEAAAGASSLLEVVRNDPEVIELETIKKLQKQYVGLAGDLADTITKSLKEIARIIRTKPPLKPKVIRYYPF